MTYQDTISISTHATGAMNDLTHGVQAIVAQSRIETGLVHVFNVGSTASIVAMEFESGLVADLPRELDRLLPPGRHYNHEAAWHDGNGHSHLQASMLGPGLTVPVKAGKLVLGTWQQICHLECDVRPRQRTIVVTVLGD